MKRRWTIAMILTVLIVGLCANTGTVKAASCNIMLSMEESSVTVGDSFVMTLAIEAEETISGVELMMTYDADYLEYVTGSPAISGEDGYLKLSQLDIETESTTASYLVKFKIIKAGVSYVKVGSNAAVYNESAGQTMSSASNVLTVEGKAAADASNNTALESLKISGGSLNSEFSKEITEYNVTVDSDVSQLIISAQAEDSKAKVEVKGADKLQPGDNEIQVIVTAESGDTREYTIHATYDETTENGEENEDSAEDGEGLTEEESTQDASELEGLQPFEMEAIKAQKTDDTIILTTYAQFTVEELENEALLPKGYEGTTILIDSCAVPVYQKTGEKSDFVLIYASREGTEPALYQYDKVEKTLQRLNHLLMVEDATETSLEQSNSGISGNHSKVYDYLLIGLAVLCIIFMGTTTIFYAKSKRREHRQ